MIKRPTQAALAVLLLLSVVSCVTIAGQRISWFHDAAKDTLKILIHYDGIHEGTGRAKKGSEQIPAFINNGDILIAEWWGHLEMGPIRAKLRTGNLVEKLLAKTLTSFQVQAIGHFTDTGGRIGAVQQITVPRVSRFIKKVNEILNAATLIGRFTDRSFPKTDALQREFARDRHEWIVLDGHQIRAQIPLHMDEAGRWRSSFLRQLVRRAFAKETAEHRDLVNRIATQIGDAPISFLQEEEMFTIVLGYKSKPVTLRLTTRDAYNAQLEEVVRKHVPNNLDLQLATALLTQPKPAEGETARPLPGILGDLVSWGPREDRIRALWSLAKAAEKGTSIAQKTAAATRSLAIQALTEIGDAWNADGHTPKAPEQEGDAEAYLGGWATWYVQATGRAPLSSGN